MTWQCALERLQMSDLKQATWQCHMGLAIASDVSVSCKITLTSHKAPHVWVLLLLLPAWAAACRLQDKL
jgi:hypothetical protein